MKLYFLRHGAAEERRVGSGDFDRRLTESGIEEVKQIAAGLARLLGDIDAAVSSPLPRALETATIIVGQLHTEQSPLQVSDLLAAGNFGFRELEEILRGAPSGCRILFVGHEPDLSNLVRELTGASIEMKKVGLAYVEVYKLERGGGVLRWLLTPRHLILAGEQPPL